MKLGKAAHVLVLGSLAACSTLVGADFDDKREPGAVLGGAGTNGVAGAVSAGSGGVAGEARAGAGGGGASSGGTPQEAGAGGDAPSAGGAGGDALGGGGSGEGGAGGMPEAGSGGVQPGGGTAGVAGVAGIAGTAGGGRGGSSAGEGGAGGEGGAAAGAGGMGQDAVVVINEVKGQGSGDDFIELYNLGPGPFDLEGYRVSDENNTFVFPNGARLAQGAYMLLLLGQAAPGGPRTCNTPDPCFHDTWGIAAGGENVFFRDPSGQQLDTTLYPNETAPGGLTNSQTWGRLPNGTGSFRATRPTAQQPNLAP